MILITLYLFTYLPLVITERMQSNSVTRTAKTKGVLFDFFPYAHANVFQSLTYFLPKKSRKMTSSPTKMPDDGRHT